MPTKQTISKATFLLIVIVSSVFLVTSTSNYVRFFSAVEQLSLEVLNVSTSIEQENVNITLVLAIYNPTRYVGLSLREFSFTLFFEADGDMTTLHGGFISYASAPEHIEPHWNKTLEREINLNPNKEATKLFKSLYETSQGKITWMLQGTAILITFVGTLDVPLSDQFP